MRAVVQRVLSASVSVEGKVVGEIGQGLLVLVAAHRLDTTREAARMADRVFGLRIFNDEAGKMNFSLSDLLRMWKERSNEPATDLDAMERTTAASNLSPPRERSVSLLSEAKSRISGAATPSGRTGREGSGTLASPAYPGVLAVSNFTVYGETAKNRRPSFIEAAPYAEGESLFNEFVRALEALGCPVEQGVFGADMKVSLVNDGPVTVILDVAPIAGA